MVARKSAGVLALLVAAAALGGCGRSRDQAPPAAAPAPPPPAERQSEETLSAPAPAAAPAPAQEMPASTRELDSKGDDEGSFAEPPRKDDDLGRAQAELERARRELEQALGVRRARPAATAGTSRGADADGAAPAPKAEKKAESGCATACRAFSSLGRAASAVCRIAGEKDTRCTQAHGVVADAEKRVAACGCRGE